MKVAGRSDRYIDPGKSEEVEVTVRAGRLPGPFTRKVILGSDDPDKRSTMLVCKGTIRSAISAKPSQLNFGRIDRDAGPQTRKIIIERGDTKDFNLTLLSNPVENMEVDLKTIEPGERYELTATLSPPWPNNPIRGALTFRTGAKECPQARLGVTMLVKPRVLVRPQQILIRPPLEPDGEYLTTLRWVNNPKFKATEASINDDKLEVSIEDRNNMSAVILKIPEDYPIRTLARRITVKTDDELMPTIEVPVRIIAKRGVRTTPPQARGHAPAAATLEKPDATRSRRALKQRSLEAHQARQGAMEPTTPK